MIVRSIRDVAGILDQVAGWVPGERYRVQAPGRPYVEELAARRCGLRVAIQTGAWAGTPIGPEVVAMIEKTGAMLESLGHHVEIAAPVIDWERFMITGRRICWQWAADCVNAASGFSGLEPSKDTLEASLLAGYQAGIPIGVELAADMCQEALLIDVSAQLELAMPWVNRRPGIHAAA